MIQPVRPEERPSAGVRLLAMHALHLGVRDLPTTEQIPETRHDTVLSRGSTTFSGTPEARKPASILVVIWTIVQRMADSAPDRWIEPSL